MVFGAGFAFCRAATSIGLPACVVTCEVTVTGPLQVAVAEPLSHAIVNRSWSPTVAALTIDALGGGGGVGL